MKEKYESPVAEIIEIDAEDIIFDSTNTCGGNTADNAYAAEC